jgi:hypothetical protein
MKAASATFPPITQPDMKTAAPAEIQFFEVSGRFFQRSTIDRQTPFRNPKKPEPSPPPVRLTNMGQLQESEKREV